MECECLCAGSGVIVCVLASSVKLGMFVSSVCVWASVKCRRLCKVRVTIACVVDVSVDIAEVVGLVDAAVVASLATLHNSATMP